MKDTINNYPKCVAFATDGNRRWAKEHGLSIAEGHKKGYEKFKEILDWVKELEIKYTIFWAFSTENWHRSSGEVEAMMELFRYALDEILSGLGKENLKMRFIGQRERFAEDIQKCMTAIEEETAHKKGGVIAIAASYGGRAEILEAVNKAVEAGKEPLSEEAFGNLLWTAGIPDPDMIIRTGGEYRLSGFLPWQSEYSELFFTKTYWPAFSKEEFIRMLAEFSKRDRRKGK